MSETTPAAVELLPVFEVPEEGNVTCPVDGCDAPVVEVEQGLAWRDLVVDDGTLRSYSDDDVSWEGEGFQCHAGHWLAAPDDFDPTYS